MFYGTDIIMWNIPSFMLDVGIFHIRLSVPHNIVMDLNNVMHVCFSTMQIYMVFGGHWARTTSQNDWISTTLKPNSLILEVDQL